MQSKTIVGEPGMTQNPRISNLLLALGEFLMRQLNQLKIKEHPPFSSIFLFLLKCIQWLLGTKLISGGIQLSRGG